MRINVLTESDIDTIWDLGVVSLKFRSSFSTTNYTSSVANIPNKSFSEMAPKFKNPSLCDSYIIILLVGYEKSINISRPLIYTTYRVRICDLETVS